MFIMITIINLADGHGEREKNAHVFMAYSVMLNKISICKSLFFSADSKIGNHNKEFFINILSTIGRGDGLSC